MSGPESTRPGTPRSRMSGEREGGVPEGKDQAFFSGRKEARMPRARKPTTTLSEIMAGR